MVETESLLTQLVFEHSLRIRMRGDALEDDASKPENMNAVLPHAASSAAPANLSDERSKKVAAKKGNIKAGASDVVPRGGRVEPKANQLVGKINNLITTDIQQINFANKVSAIRKYCAFYFERSTHPIYLTSPHTTASTSLQVLFSVLFLYRLLGWRCVFPRSIFFELPSHVRCIQLTRRDLRYHRIPSYPDIFG